MRHKAKLNIHSTTTTDVVLAEYHKIAKIFIGRIIQQNLGEQSPRLNHRTVVEAVPRTDPAPIPTLEEGSMLSMEAVGNHPACPARRKMKKNAKRIEIFKVARKYLIDT